MIFDIHGDIWTDVTTKRINGVKDVIRTYHLDRFKKGNMAGGIFVIWADPPYDIRPKERLIESVIAMSGEIWQNQDIIKIIYNSSDFYRAVEENRLGILIGVEGLSSLGENIEGLYSLYQIGVRHCSLTWNEENFLATGIEGDINRGLTELGKEAIKIIEDLGIILDVSHANDKTFWDIYENTNKPFIASHSNCRSLCDVRRNLTDDQIKAIGEKGGLVGINGFNKFIHREREKQTAEYLANHIDHVVELIGIDHIAFGFDFFEYLEDDTTDSFVEGGYRGTIGLEDISKTDNLIKVLRKRGYKEEDIEKISYRNFLNVMDKIL
jgi:membrane dipeptidase